MKTTSKKTATSVEISVVLDKNDLEIARVKALATLAKNLKVAGFRAGKAPANVVEKHVDPNELSSQTLDIAIRSSLPEAFEAEKIQPLSLPNVEVEKYVPGEMVEFKIKSDIYPEVKLGDHKKLKSKAEKVEVKEADIKDVLERIAQSFAEPKVVKRKAKLNDEVVIDFVGKKDGEAFDGGSAKDFKLTLGSGQFIPGFEDGVVGHESGDKFELELSFPKDYHNKDLAGAKTVFEVLLKQVNEITLPKFDDEFAKKTGAFTTLKELKEDIKKNLLAQGQQQASEKHKDALIRELVGISKVEAPESLVKEQLRAIRDDLERNVRSHGLSLEKYFEQIKMTEEAWEKDAKKSAEDRVKASIILQELAKKLKISVDDELVQAKIAELKEVYKKDEAALKQLEEPRVQADIANRLRIEKTLEALAKDNA